MIHSEKTKGVTLVETTLVLAVAGLLVVLGLKVYQGNAQTMNIMKLQSNVDQLFQALAQYYHANCEGGALSPNPPNFLSPYTATSGVSYPPSANVVVSIPSTLAAQGFLSGWNPTSPLVNASQGDSGYVAQLNYHVMNPIQVNACFNYNPSYTNPTVCASVTTSPMPTIPSSQAEIVTWSLQVAVQVTSSYNLQSLAASMGATCVSSISGSLVTPCPGSGTGFLVWSRSPSFAATKKISPYTYSKALLPSFKQQQTHDEMAEFGQIIPSASQPVYYLCGG